MRDRHGRQRQYVVCPPHHFDVVYSINPWMSSLEPVDRALAHEQWEALVAVFDGLGHRVHRVTPAVDLPDMVFAANAAMVLDGKVLGASFHHPQRRPEADRYRTWFEEAGFEVRVPEAACEGEGDFVWVAGTLLAGTGFRTHPQAHREAAEFFGKPTVSLTLVDPLFYHLDTALFALDDDNVAYYPGAFSPTSRQALADLFPEAVIATREDAMSFGLNSVSDGRHVVIADGASHLIDAIADHGYVPVPIDMSELRKAGGGAKCCTLEIRA